RRLEPCNQLVIGKHQSSLCRASFRSRSRRKLSRRQRNSRFFITRSRLLTVSVATLSLEVVMKRLILLLALVVVAGGCAYPTAPLSNGYPAQYPGRSRPYGAQLNLAATPVGRWDNVMMTAVGTPLFVLMMNGDTASGEVVSATRDNLR